MAAMSRHSFNIEPYGSMGFDGAFRGVLKLTRMNLVKYTYQKLLLIILI
jgi:hypothetical protein